MKRFAAITAFMFLMAAVRWIPIVEARQRPTPTVVGGATSSGTPVALLTDSTGRLIDTVGMSVATTAYTSQAGFTTGPLAGALWTVAALSAQALDSLSCMNHDATNSAEVAVYDATAASVTLGTTLAKDGGTAPATGGFVMTNLHHAFANGITIGVSLTTSRTTAASTPLVCTAGYYAQ